MKLTSGAKPSPAQPGVQILHEEELSSLETTTTETSQTATVTTLPTAKFPPAPPPSPAPAPPQQSLLPAFQALAMVLSGRIMGLLLVLSAIVFGGMAVHDPEPLRLIAAAGYAAFCLSALWVIPRR